MSPALKFDQGYREIIDLPGGQRLRLRLILADDRHRLLQGLQDLSDTSRHNRFMGAKRTMSDAELHYFTELDQIDHFALGVVELSTTGEEGQGVAVARFIRLAGDDTLQISGRSGCGAGMDGRYGQVSGNTGDDAAD